MAEPHIAGSGPGLQQDSQSYLSGYHHWLLDTRRTNSLRIKDVHGQEVTREGGFVTRAELDRFFTVPILTGILRELFPARRPKVSLDEIRQHSLCAFGILLAIGKGYFIEHFVRVPELRDNRLPLSTRPEQWQERATDQYWEDFYNEQWPFLPVILDSSPAKWHDRRVLPFLRQDHCERGGSSNVHVVQLHEDLTTQLNAKPEVRQRRAASYTPTS